MKKITLFLLSFTLFACNNPNVNNTLPNDKVENLAYSSREDTIDGIICTYIYENGERARIITSEMMLDSMFLRKAINKLTVTEKQIYFHISDLMFPGEEYAILTSNIILIYNDPPKTKNDVEVNNLVAEMVSEISNLELLDINSNLEFESINSYIETLNNASQIYIKHKESENIKLKNQAIKLSQKLKSTQIKLFPKLRKIFAQESKERLWQEDIEVEYSGRVISFIGYIYASNKNIKESYEAIADLLYKLRFTQVNFKWTQGSEYTYYSTGCKSDSEIE
jgi:hypothetical protein